MLTKRGHGWRALACLSLLAALLSTGSDARADGSPLVLWHAYRGAEQNALEQILASFEGQVELLAVPHDAFSTKLSAAIPLGEGPDLFIDAHERLGDYHARGLVAPVGDAIGSHPSRAFEAQALSAVALEGKPFGVPLSQKCLALYYNTALVARPPSSLEGLGEVLRAPLAKGSFLLAYETASVYAHAPLLAAFGGRLLAAEDRFGFVGPEAEASLLYARGLVRNKVAPSSADGALVTRLFSSGKAAFAISGPWLATDLGKGKLRYRVMPLPVLAKTGKRMRPLLTVEAVMLSPHGAAKADVRRLAAHLASRSAAELRQRVARIVSARSDVVIPADDHFLRAFADAAKHAVPMPTSIAMRAVWEPALKALRKVMRGTVEPGPALIEAQRRFVDVRRPLPPKASPTPALIVLGLVLLLAAGLLVRRARDASFRQRVRESLPAYRYTAHAVVAVGLLVFVPLIAGAAISLYAGRPGQQYYVGLTNFIEILTVRGGPLLSSGSFYLVLLVTLAWTVANLFLHLSIGMSLGVLLSRPVLRMKAVYRVLDHSLGGAELRHSACLEGYVSPPVWRGHRPDQQPQCPARRRHRAHCLVRPLLDGVYCQFGDQRVARLSLHDGGDHRGDDQRSLRGARSSGGRWRQPLAAFLAGDIACRSSNDAPRRGARCDLDLQHVQRRVLGLRRRARRPDRHLGQRGLPLGLHPASALRLCGGLFGPHLPVVVPLDAPAAVAPS